MSSTSALAGSLDIARGVEREPLTDQEVKLLHRLLSDPSLLPREFKQWVTDHASDSVDITKSQVHGLISSQGSIIFTAASWEQLGAALCPMIVPYPATLPPKNWLSCDGSYYLESEYPQLFSFIGHAHDPVVSSGQFAVPDLRGRAIYGYDPNSGTGYLAFASHDSSALGARGPTHRHESVVTTPVNVGIQLASGATYPRFSNQDLGYWTNDSNPQRQPAYYALNYIIASGQVPH